MYNIDTKYFKRNKILAYGMIATGIIFPALFALAGELMFGSLNDYDSSVKAVDVDIVSYPEEGFEMFAAEYAYEVGDKVYKCRDNYASSEESDITTQSPKTMTIYYRANKPSECTTVKPDHNYRFITILAAIISIPLFISRGLGLLLSTNKAAKNIEKLQTNGKLIQGLDYTVDTRQNAYYNISSHRFIVDYTSPTTQKTLHLKGNKRIDFLVQDSDQKADLLIDENNPKIYYIDLNITRK